MNSKTSGVEVRLDKGTLAFFQRVAAKAGLELSDTIGVTLAVVTESCRDLLREGVAKKKSRRKRRGG